MNLAFESYFAETGFNHYEKIDIGWGEWRFTEWNFDGTVRCQFYQYEGGHWNERVHPPWWWNATDQTEPTAPWWKGGEKQGVGKIQGLWLNFSQ